MDNPQHLTVLSLCSGYGGLELGLSRALENPLRVIAVEVEAYALANLVAKAEEGKLAIEALYPDLKTFPAERFSGCFDIITAGYPCQPFSHAGKRQGCKDERYLWPDIREHIRTIRPTMVLLENVAGHVSLGFKEVVYSLQRMGYTVEGGLFTAAEVGAPHRRQRLYVLAHAEGYEGCLYPRWRGEGQGETDAGRAGKGMADAGGVGRRGRDNGEHGRQGRSLQVEGSGALADTDMPGTPPGGENRGVGRQQESATEIMADADGERLQEPLRRRLEQEYTRSVISWPARSGQEQYAWEEPRTVMSKAGYRLLTSYIKKYKTPFAKETLAELAYAESYGDNAIKSAVGRT
ncbi:hypothetical protein LCGC14_1927650, partial [marine sediment metagenome]